MLARLSLDSYTWHLLYACALNFLLHVPPCPGPAIIAPPYKAAAGAAIKTTFSIRVGAIKTARSHKIG